MAISREDKKTKTNMLVSKIKSFNTQISNPSTPLTRTMVQDFVKEILALAKSQCEVVRLSECVTMYRLSDDKDSYFKGLLRKELYKFYASSSA